MAKNIAKKIAKTYKEVRGSIRKAGRSDIGRAISLHADKTLGAAAEKTGTGAMYRAARNAAIGEFGSSEGRRKKHMGELRKQARGN